MAPCRHRTSLPVRSSPEGAIPLTAPTRSRGVQPRCSTGVQLNGVEHLPVQPQLALNGVERPPALSPAPLAGAHFLAWESLRWGDSLPEKGRPDGAGDPAHWRRNRRMRRVPERSVLKEWLGIPQLKHTGIPQRETSRRVNPEIRPVEPVHSGVHKLRVHRGSGRQPCSQVHPSPPFPVDLLVGN